METELLGSEAHILCRDEAGKEIVDAVTNRCNLGHDAVGTGLPIQATDVVRHVIEHREVVFHHHDITGRVFHVVFSRQPSSGAPRVDQSTNNVGGGHTLPDVEEGRSLVEHVHVCLPDAYGCDRKALKLAPRERGDLAIEEMCQIELLCGLLPAASLVTLRKTLPNLLSNKRAHIVRVELYFVSHLEIVLEQTGEVLLQLGTAVVSHDLRPPRWVLDPPQVGLQLA
mmetsp:Transcript_49237/g.110742  ORF Transcript_49237/g.110742 Transcript_49237/m.110742 type:complete len:226 (+) Transcript_49237:1654-2331(+)